MSPTPNQNPNPGVQGQSQYQGKPATILRDTRSGDPGFVAGLDQVVIRVPDGSERTVPRSEVTPQ